MDHLESLKQEIAEYRFLVELDDRLRPLMNAADITSAAAEFLGCYLAVSRCTYANVEADQTIFNLQANYTNGVRSIVGRYDATAFGTEFVRLSQIGVPYVVEDAENDIRTIATREIYRQAQIRAVISVPVVRDGKFVASMAVHQTTPRKWLPVEIRLIGMVANRCWESIERNRITRDLRESEAKFRTITNAMPQMVWAARADGFVDYQNKQLFEFAGFAPGTTIGNTWAELIHPDDRHYAYEQWSRSISTGSSYETIYRLRHYSGEYRWTLARALPVRNEDGIIVKWMGTNTDIHSQKLAEQVLQDANHRKDEFLAMLAHELRNPLSPISAAAELLSITRSSDAQVQRATAIIRRQVGHMSSLIDELLDVSRVTRGLVQLENTFVDMKQVVAEAVEQVRPLIEAKRHELTVQLASEAVFAIGDHKRLVQALTNLLDNSAKYTNVGGHITVALEARVGEVLLLVNDDGIGINPQLLGNVFDLFQQGERTADRVQGGLGIGLALVKDLIERHHGSVAARSPGLNRGSEFEIRLPRTLKFTVDNVQALPELAAIPRKRRVLVVDDNIDTAHTIAMLLEAQGNEVTVEVHPYAAITRAQRESFDVCLLDIGLPDMDGYELVQRLQAMNKAQKVVAVAITGYGQERDKQRSAAAGFNYHLVKPINVRHLTDILNELE